MFTTAGSGNNRRDSMTVLPICSACHNYRKEGYTMIKSICLAPCGIKSKDDTEIIYWRCDRGGSCESDCIYAVAREKLQQIPVDPIGANGT
jgi:hypothetical protein